MVRFRTVTLYARQLFPGVVPFHLDFGGRNSQSSARKRRKLSETKLVCQFWIKSSILVRSSRLTLQSSSEILPEEGGTTVFSQNRFQASQSMENFSPTLARLTLSVSFPVLPGSRRDGGLSSSQLEASKWSSFPPSGAALCSAGRR